jgi:DivIVA domain-containing protein
MAWFFAVLLVALIGGVVMVAAGRGESMAPSVSDDPPLDLPDGPLTAADLRQVRFNVAFRGYRAAEVDELLERLATQLDERG